MDYFGLIQVGYNETPIYSLYRGDFKFTTIAVDIRRLHYYVNLLAKKIFFDSFKSSQNMLKSKQLIVKTHSIFDEAKKSIIFTIHLFHPIACCAYERSTIKR